VPDEGGDAAVITSDVAVAVAVMVMELDVALPAVFVACTVNVDEPPVVGVPDNTPAGLNVKPAGNAPEATDHVGAGDPDAVNV
jgi:hypothetical protein